MNRKKKHIFFGAFVLMFAFAVNSIPVVYLHHVFSNHHHAAPVKNNKEAGKKEITQKINCGCEKLFTETLYTVTNVSLTVAVVFEQPNKESAITHPILSRRYTTKYRGPPSI